MNNIEDSYIWTEEKCIELIREYKSRSILWDSKDVSFYKHTARNEAWESLGRALNISPNECKYKMNILMSSFRREKAKYKKGLISGKPYVTTWFAFGELTFLMNRTIPKKKEDDSDELLLLGNRCPQIELFNPDIQIQLKNKKSQQLTTGHSPVPNEMTCFQNDTNDYDIKLELESEAESDLEECCNQTTTPTPGPSRENKTIVKTYSVQTSTDPVNTEEIEAFTNFIKHKMMKYSVTTEEAVQKEICDILFKADDGYYENASTTNRRPTTNIPLKRRRESNINIERMVFQDSDSSV